MASFGIGELPDGGGSEVWSARRGPGKIQVKKKTRDLKFSQ